MANDALVAEEIGRVFELYGAQLRTFRRTLFGLLVIGLSVFALIVVPFLGFSVQLADLESRAARLAEDRAKTDAAVAQGQAELDTMRALLNRIHAFADFARSWEAFEEMIETARKRVPSIREKRAEYADHSLEGLRDWAAGGRPEPPAEAHQTIRHLSLGIEHPCEWRLTDSSQGVADYVACTLCNSFRAENRRFLRQIAGISSATLGAAGTDKEALTGVVDRACGWLNRADEHWRMQSPRPDDAHALRGFFTWDLRQYEDALFRVRDVVNARIPLVEAEIDDLESAISATRADLEAASAELERMAKFDKLTTPIGEVPITVIQLVLLFPAALAAGCLVVASSLARLVILRHTLTRLFAIRDREGAVIDPTYIAVIAPLWLDREEGILVIATKWVVLLTPLGLIIASLVMIHAAGIFAQARPDGSAISSAAYLWLYAVSMALTLGALAHIWRIVFMRRRWSEEA